MKMSKLGTVVVGAVLLSGVSAVAQSLPAIQPMLQPITLLPTQSDHLYINLKANGSKNVASVQVPISPSFPPPPPNVSVSLGLLPLQPGASLAVTQVFVNGVGPTLVNGPKAPSGAFLPSFFEIEFAPGNDVNLMQCAQNLQQVGNAIEILSGVGLVSWQPAGVQPPAPAPAEVIERIFFTSINSCILGNSP